MHDPLQPHNVDDIFARGLKNAAQKAPEGVWQGIADAMETDALRKKVLWARLTAAASVTLLIGFGAWYIFLGRYPEPGITMAQRFAAHHEVGTPSMRQRPAPAQTEVDCAGEMQAEELPSTRFAGLQIKTQGIRSRLAKRLLNTIRQRRLDHVHSAADFGPDLLHQAIGYPVMAFEPDQQGSILQLPQPTPLKVNELLVERYQPKSSPRVQDDALAQGGEDDQVRKARAFTLGGTASPDFSFASQTPVSLAKVSTSSKNALPEDAVTAARRTTPSTAFTSGVRMGYALSDRFGLQTGILYTRRSTDRDHAITQTGTAEAVETHFDLNSVEIPATLRYNVVDRPKFDYYVNSGVSATLFMNYKQSLITSSGVSKQVLSDESSAGTPAQASVLASTGVQVQLSKHISMNVEPGLRYGLFVNEYSFTQRHPLSFNAFSGINYHF
jgi:hypothetical protein